MRATLVSTILGLGAAALAQDLAALPVCAQTAAVGAAASTGCTPTDVACLCQNFGSLRGTIQAGCPSASDQQAACAWGNSACASYGVSIPCDTTASSDTAGGMPLDTMTADSAAPTDMSAGTVDPMMTATDTSMTGTDGAKMPTATDSMMSSMMSSMTSSTMSGASVGMTNGTMATHPAGNMTHSATMSMSATGSGPTSTYTGAASAAVRRRGVFGAVMGVAALFAFF